jgi:hypothetical protein
MGGEWARVGSLAGEAVEPGIGDVWVDKRYVEHAAPEGRVSISDTLPFVGKDEPPKRVERVIVYYHATGAREGLSIEELRKRFVFRRKA